MLNPLQNAELFLINILFDLYLTLLMVRLVLAWVRADQFNPVTRFIIRFTQPIIAPLRRIIPTYAHIEFSTLLLIILLDMLKFLLVGFIVFGLPSSWLGLLIIAIADSFKLLLNTFFYAILLQAILSWFQMAYSPIMSVLNQLTSPIMRPIQRLIPPVSGFDISPIPAIILLQLLIILVANPLLAMGTSIAFG